MNWSDSSLGGILEALHGASVSEELDRDLAERTSRRISGKALPSSLSFDLKESRKTSERNWRPKILLLKRTDESTRGRRSTGRRVSPCVSASRALDLDVLLSRRLQFCLDVCRCSGR